MRITEKHLNYVAHALSNPVTSIFIDRTACTDRVRVYEETCQKGRCRVLYFKTNKQANEYLLKRLEQEYEKI